MPQPTKKLLNVLSGHISPVPPLWLMRQAGRYLPEYREIRTEAKNFLDMCYSPRLAAEVTLQPIRRFGFDAAIIFSDILVIPDALGIKVEFQENHGPVLCAVESGAALPAFNAEKIKKHLSPVYEAISLVASSLPKETTLIGFAGSPWTLAAYVMEGKGSKDFSRAKETAYSNPDFFQKLITLLTEAIILHLDLQIKAGAEVVQLFDSWSGVLPEMLFRKYVIEPTKVIVSRLKELHPAIPIIGFPRGAAFFYEEYVKETRVNAVGIDTQTPLSYARKTLSPYAVLQGNLDPSLLVAGGNALEETIEQMLCCCSDVPFIFNLGHGIVPHTPVKHVEMVIRKIRG